jgi:hypothetical protein
MSQKLLRAEGDYLHSPLDDLEAFFWVALWSVIFNTINGGSSALDLILVGCLGNARRTLEW